MALTLTVYKYLNNNAPVQIINSGFVMVNTFDYVYFVANPSAGDNSGIAYNWTIKTGSNIVKSSSTRTLIIETSAPTTQSLIVTITVSNNDGSGTSATLDFVLIIENNFTLSSSLIFNNSLITISNLPCGSTGYVPNSASNASLTVVATGGDGSGFTYSWLLNGSPITPKQANMESIVPTSFNMGTTYTLAYDVTISDVSGTMATPITCSFTAFVVPAIYNTFSYNINGGPTKSFNCAGGNISVAAGSTLTITSGATGGSGIYNYIWGFGTSVISIAGPTSAPSFINPTTVGVGGLYTLYIGDVNYTNIFANCSFDVVIMNPLITSVAITPTTNKIDANFTCGGMLPITIDTPLLLTAFSSNLSAIYQWYEDGVTLIGATGPTFSPDTSELGSNVYNVIVTAGLAVASCSVTVIVEPVIEPSILFSINGVTLPEPCGSTLSVPLGSYIILAPLPQNLNQYAYNWTQNGVQYSNAMIQYITVGVTGTFVYVVTITQIGNIGITATCQFTLNVVVPSVNIAVERNGVTIPFVCGNTINVCLDDVLELTAEPNPSVGVVGYEWLYDEMVVSMDQTFSPVTSQSGIFTYTVVASFTGGATASCAITIAIFQPPSAQIYAVVNCGFKYVPRCGGSLNVNQRDHVILSVMANQNTTYQWLLDGVVVSTNRCICVNTNCISQLYYVVNVGLVNSACSVASCSLTICVRSQCFRDAHRYARSLMDE